MKSHSGITSATAAAWLACTLVAAIANAGPADSRQVTFHATRWTDETPPPTTVASDHPDTTFATPPVASAGPSDLLRYQAQVQELELREGLYAPALAEAHASLAELHTQQGNLEEGLTALERSRQVIRVNAGLYSEQQLPVMRSMVAANLALGRHEQAHAVQQGMFDLRQRLYGSQSMEFVPALLEWADWNVSLHLDDAVSAVQGLALQGGPGTGATVAYRSPALQEAYQRYVAALAILHEQARADDPRLVDTERKLAALNYMVNRDMEQAISRTPAGLAGGFNQPNPERVLERTTMFHFLNGSSALKRAVAYGYVAPDPDYDVIASRLMELGDWYLLFDRRAAALEIYGEALTLLADAGAAQSDIERIVASGMPVRTPDAAYIDDGRPEQYAGFIDVEFALNKWGMASGARVIASSEADPKIEKELLRTIRNGRFRPRFEAGSAVSEDNVRLRYWYAM